MSNTGKIARLPHALREQLNHRLRDAEPAEPLLRWLNALPEVQAILQQQFAGHPINPQNLSEWRNGAFAEWSLRQEIFGSLQSADETATTINEMSDHRLADKLLTILTARYARFMNRWDGEVTPAINQQLKALSRLTRDLTTLQKAARRTTESDRIKPNQGIPGMGTARPHTTPGSPEPTQDARPEIPDPSATPTLAFSPPPLDLSTDPIRPNQGHQFKTLADLSPDNFIPAECREIMEELGLRQRLQDIYDAFMVQTVPASTGESGQIKPNQGIPASKTVLLSQAPAAETTNHPTIA